MTILKASFNSLPKIILQPLVFLAFCFLPGLCLANTDATTPTEIIIAADEWLPYTGTENGAAQGKGGYLIDIAKAIYEPLGIKVQYKVQPWERALNSVRSKTANCVAGAYTTDAPDFLFPKAEQGASYNVFFVAKNSEWNYENIDSLKKIRLAVIGGYSYDGGPMDSYIGQSINSTTVQIVNGNGALGQNIQKVVAGRADVTIDNEAVFNLKTEELGLTNKFKSAGRIEKLNKVYIACGAEKEGNVQLIQLLDEGMAKIRSSGELAKILENYHMKDWISTP